MQRLCPQIEVKKSLTALLNATQQSMYSLHFRPTDWSVTQRYESSQYLNHIAHLHLHDPLPGTFILVQGVLLAPRQVVN
jgi:hypothetical protein